VNSICDVLSCCAALSIPEAGQALLLLERIEQRLTEQLPSGMLSPASGYLLQAYVSCNFYARALRVLQNVPLAINPEQNGLSVEHFLIYYYCAGCIFIGLKRFEEAADSFNMALCLPAVSSISGVQLLAFKKLQLVSIIESGSVALIPHHVSETVSRLCKALSIEYLQFAELASKGEAEQAKALLKTHEAQFNQDNNMGLAFQALDGLARRKIRQLTRTFITMSLTQLSKMAQLQSEAEAEHHLISMVDEGSLHAVITHSSAGDTVQFLDPPQRYDTLEMVKILDSKIKEVAALQKVIAQRDSSLFLDPKVVKAMEVGLRSVSIDEDMMVSGHFMYD
jgi:COP9 signalosome complex subunit 3